MLRRTAVAFMIMSAVLFAAGTANAQYNQPSIGADDTTPNAGQTIHVTGSGCVAGEDVAFAFDGTPAGGAVADANGDFAGDVTVPSNATPGAHTITATCGTLVQSLEITVNPAPVAAAAIPRTGSSSTIPLTSVALALLAVGGLFVLFARRRRVARVTA